MLRLRPLALLLCIAFALCLVGLRGVLSQSGGLRRVTNTTEEGINLNPSLSGDGRRIAFETTEDVARAGGTDFFRAIIADVSGATPTFAQVSASRAVAPAISQDGTRIAFASKENPLGTNQDGNSEIFFYDGAALRQLTNTSPGNIVDRVRNGNFQPSMSDDARFIAFASNRNLTGQNADGNMEIFVFDNATQGFTQLTDTLGTVGASDAKISGGGTRVAYIRDTGANASTQRDLLIQDRTGGVPRVIGTALPGLAMTYGRAISDDGTRVVYAAETATNSSQVFLFDARSGNQVRPITFLGSRATDVPLHPTISGDGTRIAFATRRSVITGANPDSSVELYTFDIPTGQLARVTDSSQVMVGTTNVTATADVVSSLNDDGTLVAFNFPRILSGTVAFAELGNNSEIYITTTAARAPFGNLTILNGASFGNEPSTTKAVAPDSIAVGLGGALANSTEQSSRQADGTFPTNVGGTTVTVNGRAAQIFYVSPSQVNFHVPAATELGTAEVIITNSDGFQTRGTVSVMRSAPGVFTYSGDGRGEAMVLDADSLTRGPFDPSNGTRRLIIFATGVRNASQVSVTIGGRSVTVESIVRVSNMPGMDEIHVLLPADLRGAGPVELVVRADNRDSNPTTVMISGDPSRDLVINEVLADPPDGAGGDANHDGTRDSSQDEFVEIVNATTLPGRTPHDIDLSGYELYTRGASGTPDTLRHKFASGTILPAGAAIVVFGGGNPDVNNPVFGGAQIVKASTGGLSLINSSGVVTLRDQAGLSGAVVALFSYGGSTGLNGDANQSLTRAPDIEGSYTGHLVATNNARAFSPGTRIDGSPFLSPPIARIEVAPASATIFEGAHQQFTATAYDSSGNAMSGVIFTWQSSNTAVATIDQNGLATGVSAGTTEIRASAHGVQSPPATLTVQFVPRVLTSIQVSPQNASGPVGGTQQYTAQALDQFGNAMTSVTFAWSSTNTSVATIDPSTGLATAISTGQTTITASAQGVNGTATLNVIPATVIINEVLADPPGSLATDLQGDANHDGVRDSSDDEFVELVNSTGAAINIAGWTLRTRPLNSSTETVRHTFAANTSLPASDAIVIFGGGSFLADDPVFGGAQVVKASTGGLSLTNSGLTIIIKDASGNVVTQFTYGTGTGLAGDQDQSLTRSPDITGGFVLHTAATGASGRRFSPGTKVDGSFFAPRVGKLTSVSISPASTGVAVGQTTQFTAQAKDQYGRTMTGIGITFASNDTNVATVESVTIDPSTGIATATVRGNSIGSAQITATASDGTTTVVSSPATLNVTAVAVVVTRVDVSPTSATINRGRTQQFTATAFDQNNQPIAGKTFTWSSSDATIATINSSGLATGVGIGTVTITASTSNGSGGTITGQATLNVQIPLLINEILADPPDGLAGDSNRDGVRDSDDDEFVELVNNSSDPVDISGVVIADSTTARFTFPANTILAAGRAVIVFGGGSPPTADPAFGGALIFTTSSLSLGNTGDTVTVRILLGSTNIVIDTKTYGAEGDANQSLTRSPDVTGAFTQHTTATNAAGRVFSPGTRVDGTPFGSPAITRIEIVPLSATHEIGETQLFTAHAFSNASGTEVEILNVNFIWDSSDASKATVSPLTGASTTATALAPGSPVIRARAGGLQGTAVLNINAPPPVLTSVVITPTSATIAVGGQQQFTAQARDQFNQPIGGVTITFASSNTTVATVDSVTPTSATGSATATVTGHATGTATISASATNGSTTVSTSPSATLTVEPAAGQLLISEFRTRGPNGANDEFIELYNPTTSTLVIGGLRVRGSTSTGTLSDRVTIPANTTLGAGCHYLVANNAASGYSGATIPNQTYTTGIADNGGVAITGSNGTTIIDAVGMSATAVKEGNPLTPLTGTANQSYERRPGGTAGNGQDTNDNATDFFLTTSNPQNPSSGCVDTSLGDVAITKADTPDPVQVNQNITYTLTVTNNGPGLAQNVTVTDNLPSQVTFVSCASTAGGVCGGTGNNRTVTFPTPLAVGSSATITIVATANGTGSTTISNTATVASTNDPNAANNSATTTTTVTSADLSIVKTDSPDPVDAGQNITYTLTVQNNTASTAAQNVVVSDTLPAGTTLVSVGTPPSGWSRTDSVASGGTGTITFSRASMPGTGPDSSAVFTITVSVDLSTPNGTVISNTATVSSDTLDQTQANNSSTATTTVRTSVDLSLTKTVNNSTPNVGDQVTFTLKLSNGSIFAATGVTVTDQLPAGLTFDSANPAAEYNSATGVWTVGTINAGTDRTLTITATVTSTAAGGVTNTATITASDQPDPNTANNQSSATVTPLQANLSITKNGSPNAVAAGDTLTYTIVVTNNGPNAAQGVTVTDNLPAELTFSACNSTSGNGTCGGTGNNRTVTFANPIANGVSETITIQATVNNSVIVGSTISNTATVTSTTFDPSTPNSATATTTVQATTPKSDLSVLKSNSPNPVTAGNLLTYTINFVNNGPDSAANVVVQDVLPVGTVFDSESHTAGWGVTAPTAGTNGTVSFTKSTVINGEAATFQIVVRVNANAVNGSTITNNATASSDSTDTDTSNNTGQASTTINTQADLSISKSAPASVVAGTNMIYTLSLTNTGPSDAQTVSLSDTLPANTTFVSLMQSSGPTATCTTPGVGSGGTVTCNIATLPAGATMAFDLVVHVNPAAASGSTITNSATASTTTTDPTPTNTAMVSTTVSTQADLSINKTSDTASPVVGQNVVFTITLSNGAQSVATGVQVTDLLPSGLLYVSSTTTQGTYDNNTGLWNVGTVNNSSSQTLTITARVQTQGAKTNTATITAADQFDPDTTNNQKSVTFTPGLPLIVVSQLYTGGGAASATYNMDFIEIFNRGNVSINLSGFSVQYADATTGTFTVIASLPNFTLAPRQYFLITAGSTNTAVGSPLPVTPDVTGSNTNMTASAGKVAIVFGTAALTSSNVNNPPLTVGNASPGCPTNASIVVDFVGYGTTASCFEGTGRALGPSNNTQSVQRAGSGCTDSNDNAADFTRATVVPPRNKDTIKASCP